MTFTGGSDIVAEVAGEDGADAEVGFRVVVLVMAAVSSHSAATGHRRMDADMAGPTVATWVHTRLICRTIGS